MEQCTSHILMVRPAAFSFNDETAVSNYFQQNNRSGEVQKKALTEFNNMVSLLQRNSIDVTILEDTELPHTPDSIFPNNCISFQENGIITLFPMEAPNRRIEHLKYNLKQIGENFSISSIRDLTPYETKGQFLEGTGSMVLDHTNRIAYACLSPRTDADLVRLFCRENNYTPCLFHAVDAQKRAIYHTNVMMSVAEEFVVICGANIINPEEKKIVYNGIKKTGKEIIEISLDQMNRFAGNMLQLRSPQGERITVMSQQAHESLSTTQKNIIEQSSPILSIPLYTIESIGGGSARCMIAEIFLPLQ